jgi:hypothetical protein
LQTKQHAELLPGRCALQLHQIGGRRRLCGSCKLLQQQW